MELLLLWLALWWLNMHRFLHKFQSVQYKGQLNNICDHRDTQSYFRVEMCWSNTFFWYILLLIYDTLIYMIRIKLLTKLKYTIWRFWFPSRESAYVLQRFSNSEAGRWSFIPEQLQDKNKMTKKNLHRIIISNLIIHS